MITNELELLQSVWGYWYGSLFGIYKFTHSVLLFFKPQFSEASELLILVADFYFILF